VYAHEWVVSSAVSSWERLASENDLLCFTTYYVLSGMLNAAHSLSLLCMYVIVVGYGKSSKLRNCKIHDCVKTDASRILRINPPEGEVQLARAILLLLCVILSSVSWRSHSIIVNICRCWKLLARSSCRIYVIRQLILEAYTHWTMKKRDLLFLTIILANLSQFL